MPALAVEPSGTTSDRSGLEFGDHDPGVRMIELDESDDVEPTDVRKVEPCEVAVADCRLTKSSAWAQTASRRIAACRDDEIRGADVTP